VTRRAGSSRAAAPAPPDAPGRARRARVGRAARALLGALLLGAVFVTALVGGLLLHVGTPLARRVLARVLSEGLSALFIGQVTVSHLDAVGPNQLAARGVVVRDPEGVVVLEIGRLRVNARAVELARRAWLGTGKQTLVIDHVRADEVTCAVLTDAQSGSPSIARAFQPTPSSRSSEPRATGEREIRVWLPPVEIGRGSARGVFPGLAAVEADVSHVIGSVLATRRGAAVDVERFGTVVRGLGKVESRGTGELHVRAPGRLWSSFDGFVGDVGVSAWAELRGQILEARVDLPRAAPDAVRAVWAAWPFWEDARVHVVARGELPSLAAQAEVDVGPTRWRADGHLRLAGDVGVRADLEAQHLDLRSLVPASPPTDIGASAQLVLFEGDEGLTVKINGITTPATVGGVEVPATDVAGALVAGVFGGKATLHERGIPVKVDLGIGRDGAVDLSLHARTFRLQRAPRIAALTTADGFADVKVTGRIVDAKLDATLDGSIDAFSFGELAARRARVSGRVRGPLAEPARLEVDLRVDASGVRSAQAAFERVDLGVSGPVARPRVRARLTDPRGPSFELDGTVEPFAARAAGLRVAVSRGGVRVEGKVDRVAIGPGTVSVAGLELRGAGGSLALDAAIDARHAVIRSRGQGVDLAEVARVLGLPPGLVSGRVAAADVDVVLHDQPTRPSRGRVVLDLVDVDVLGLSDARLRVEGTLEHDELDGHGALAVPALGEATLDVGLRLGGAPLAAEAWSEATGATELRLGGVELAEVAAWLEPWLGGLGFAGRASGALRLSRDDASAMPDIDVAVTTEGLAVRRGAREYRGVDLGAMVLVDGGTGEAELSVNVGAADGILANGRAAVELDLPALMAEPARAAELLLASRARATVRVPSRSLTALPELVPPLGVEGAVEARIEATGTVGDPLLVVGLTARQLRALEGPFQVPLDGSATVTLRPRTGAVGANADVRYEGNRIVYATAEGALPLAAALAEGPRALAGWTGAATARFFNLPLGILPYVTDLGLQGAVRGVAAIERAEGDPQLRAGLDVQQLAVNGVAVGAASMRLAPTTEQAELYLSLDEGARGAGGDGSPERPPLAAGVRAGLRWRDGIPSLDPAVPIHVHAQADALEARALTPAVRGVLTELSGRVDGMVHVTLRAEEAAATAGAAVAIAPPPDVAVASGAIPAAAPPPAELTAASAPPPAPAEPAVTWRAEVEGALGLDGGVVQLAGLGLRVTDLTLDARATIDGQQTIIHVTRIEGQARSATPNVKGWAELHLDRAGLAGGKGALAATQMPVPIGGVSLATVTGQSTFELHRMPAAMEVEVLFERMEASVPLSATRSVLDTEDHPDITVAQPLRERRAAVDEGATPWHLVFDLGAATRLVQSDIVLPLSGRPEILLGAETALGGYVDLEPGGRLPILGKTFRVESGRVWFDPEEPANPSLNVVASWQANEATVFLRILGRWESPKLKLESEPPYSEDQIFVLLLGGSLDDARASQEGTQLQAAYGAAQVLGMGQLFAGTALSDIEVSPDTEEGATRYRASYRLSDRVRLEGIYQPEARTAAGPSDQADSSSGTLDEARRRDSFAAAVELGLGAGWFLRTEAGNASAEADVLWQYRY